MGSRSITVDRFKEIERRLREGRGLREIARALKCSRKTVREVRDGLRLSPAIAKAVADPLWMSQVDWSAVQHELGLGHPLKFIWEERARALTSYPNFWKQFYRKFPERRAATVTAREFAPGERVEVDYAGEGIEWVETRTGEIRRAAVFVAGLGFSQLLFAWAAEDMRSRNFLDCHQRMYAFFGGVPHVTVPDCLKQGVAKCHLYDPDLNPSYATLAAHYGTAVVPARPAHPRDKAIVEGLVKILMRYFRFCHRGRRFTSVQQINEALGACVARLNERPHTRFAVSRRERFEHLERSALKCLPSNDFENAEWRDSKLHPDCYIVVDAAYYSAPHVHRGKRLRVKLTQNQIEIFHNGARVALHPRDRSRTGARVRIDAHFPPNALAYYEATPQHLLCQSRFIHPDLNALVVELFNLEVYGNIRRVQGLIRSAAKEIHRFGRDAAIPRIIKAIAEMRERGRVRVPYFCDLLARLRAPLPAAGPEREIVRRPGNPLLRYARESTPDAVVTTDPIPLTAKES